MHQKYPNENILSFDKKFTADFIWSAEMIMNDAGYNFIFIQGNVSTVTSARRLTGDGVDEFVAGVGCGSDNISNVGNEDIIIYSVSKLEQGLNLCLLIYYKTSKTMAKCISQSQYGNALWCWLY